MDLSDKREAYKPCPKCNSEKLMFGSLLDWFVVGKLSYTSSISCEKCGFTSFFDEADLTEEDKIKKVSFYEKNRLLWNALYDAKTKQN